MTTALYKDRILDHFHRPRHRGALEGMDAVGRGVIPLCGDEVEVGVKRNRHGHLTVRFRGRGCAICIASASMMTDAISGRSIVEADRLTLAFLDWMREREAAWKLDSALGELVETFGPVRQEGARISCAVLPWDALREALASA